MKNNKKTVVGLVLIISMFISSLTLAIELPLTMEQAKELAVKNSLEMQQSQITIDKADKGRRDADEAYEKARATYFSERQESAIVAVREAYRAALNGLNDAKISYEHRKIALEYDVENLFLNIINLDKDIKLSESDLAIQGNLIRIERLMLELGLSTNNKLDLMILNYNNLQNSLAGKYNALNTFKWAMNRYIGGKTDDNLELSDTSVALNMAIPPIEDTYKKVLENYLAIDQIKRTIAEKEKDKDWYDSNQSDKIENLNNTIRENQVNLANAEYQVKLSVKNIYDALKLSNQNLSNAYNNNELAKKLHAIDESKKSLGMISEIEFQISKKTLEQAGNAYTKANYDYYMNFKQLELAEKGILLGK